MVSSSQRQAFGRALDQALGSRTRAWLGAALSPERPISPSAVGQWISGETVPADPERVFAIERLLELAPGVLSRHLGYLPVDAVPATNVREAIESDPDLIPDFRLAVLRVYDALRTTDDNEPSPVGSSKARKAKARPST